MRFGFRMCTFILFVCSIALSCPDTIEARTSKNIIKKSVSSKKINPPAKKRRKLRVSQLLAEPARLPEKKVRLAVPPPVDAVSSAESLVHELGIEESDVAVAKVGEAAFSLLGKRYRFGGSGTYGIDCSAFVRTVFNRLSISLPRTAREQFAVGVEVPVSDLQKGDLLFFHTYRADASHVGIYLGNDRMIHASSGGRRVMISNTTSDYYRTRFLGARRITPDSLNGGLLVDGTAPSLRPVLELLAESGISAKSSF